MNEIFFSFFECSCVTKCVNAQGTENVKILFEIEKKHLSEEPCYYNLNRKIVLGILIYEVNESKQRYIVGLSIAR